MTELDCRILARACDLNWAIVGGISNLFSTPDDWELVRVNVVMPNQEAFCEHLDKHGVWMIIWFSLSSEDRNKIAADFIKSHPGLFPWVVELIPMDWLMMEEKR